MDSEIHQSFSPEERERLAELLIINIKAARSAKRILGQYAGLNLDMIDRDVDVIERMVKVLRSPPVPRRAPHRAFLGEKPCGDPDCECHDS
jgi:hypothetical protein